MGACDAGVVLPRDSLRVGRPTSATLALSDLVLGNRATNLAWRRTAEDTVLFNPLRTFRRDEDMGVPGRIVRAVDDALRRRIEETWSHYVMQARAHRAGRYPLVAPSAD